MARRKTARQLNAQADRIYDRIQRLPSNKQDRYLGMAQRAYDNEGRRRGFVQAEEMKTFSDGRGGTYQYPTLVYKAKAAGGRG